MTNLTRISGYRLDTDSKEIRFDLTSRGERIKCRIAPDYLEDLFGPLLNIDDFFAGAEAFRSDIQRAIKELIDAKRFETDRSVLLRRFG